MRSVSRRQLPAHALSLIHFVLNSLPCFFNLPSVAIVLGAWPVISSSRSPRSEMDFELTARADNCGVEVGLDWKSTGMENLPHSYLGSLVIGKKVEGGLKGPASPAKLVCDMVGQPMQLAVMLCVAQVCAHHQVQMEDTR
jgi:hypothetical protein